MKFRQQIKTSATNLLGKSGQGFGTVAAHLEIPRGVREYTDNLGINLIEGEAKASYCFALVEGWLLLNRTIVAPADQTGRSNHVAHTLAAPESELQIWLNQQQVIGAALWSPAALILQFEVNGLWKDSWNEDPRELGESDMIDIPHLDGEVLWTPSVWQGHPEKALAALTSETSLKELKWNWEGINDAVDQLKCYAQAFAVLDPDQGKTRTRPEIDALFPTNLRAAWGWTFATVVLDAQRPDEFKWFGVSKERSRGNTSKREEFVPLQAETTLDDPRAGYVKNKEEAITQMNREAYHKASNNLKSVLEEWSSKFGKQYPQNFPDAPNCLSELDQINESCSLSRTEIDAKKDELTQLENNLAEAKEALNKSRDNAERWRKFAENAITQSVQIGRPTSLDEVLREYASARYLWSDNTAAELDSELHRLEGLTQNLESKIKELNSEKESLQQSIKNCQPTKREMQHPQPGNVLPGPSLTATTREPVRNLPSPDPYTRDRQSQTPIQQFAGTSKDSNPAPKVKNTKREANTIWMWILGTTFMVLIGVIGWALGDNLGYKRGKDAHDRPNPDSQYKKGLADGRAERVAEGLPHARTSPTSAAIIPSKTSSPTGSTDSPKPSDPVVSEPEQSSPATKTQMEKVKEGAAPNESTSSTPQPESRPKSNELSGAKDAPQNPQVETLMNEDASRSPLADLQGKPAGKSPEPTASPSSKEASQGEKAADKANSSPKASKPSAPVKDNLTNDAVKPSVVPNTPEPLNPDSKSEAAKNQ